MLTAQRVIRGHLGRRYAHSLRRTTAYYTRRVPAAVTIQRVYRGHVVRLQERDRRRRKWAVGIVQRGYRRWRAWRDARSELIRRRAARMHAMACRLQARARGMAARRLCGLLRRETEALRLMATSILQRAWRAAVVRRVAGRIREQIRVRVEG